MGGAHEAVKQGVETGSLVLLSDAFISLHARSVQSHIPVSQVLKETQDFLHDGVKAVVVELMSAEFNQVLVGGHNPLVHVVGSLRFTDSHTHLIIEHKIVSASLLVAGNVLDEEAVGVEVGKEDILNNVFNSLFLEFEGFSTHHRGVAEVQPARVSAVLVCNLGGVRVVSLTLGHLGAVFGQHDSVDNQVLERCDALNGGGDGH